jgi:hypothetical protein
LNRRASPAASSAARRLLRRGGSAEAKSQDQTREGEHASHEGS